MQPVDFTILLSLQLSEFDGIELDAVARAAVAGGLDPKPGRRC